MHKARTFLALSLLGQLLALGALPMLSRVLSPEDFGLLQTLISFVGLAAAVSHWRTDLSVQTIPKSDVRRLCANAHVLTALTSLIWAVLFAVLYGTSIGISIAMFFAISGSALTAIHIGSALRESRRVGAGVRNLLLTGVSAAAQVLGGVLYSLTGAVVLFALVRFIPGAFSRISIREVSGSRVRRLAIGQAGATVVTLLSQGALALPLLALPFVMSGEGFGTFSLAWRIMAVPMALAGVVLSQLWMSHTAHRIREGRMEALARDYIRATLAASGASVVIVLCLVVAVGRLQGALFGAGWADLSLFLWTLVPLSVCQLAIAPFGQTLLLLGRAKLQLIHDSLRVLGLCAAVLVCVNFGKSDLFTAQAIVFVAAISYVLLGVVVYQVLSRSARGYPDPHGERGP